MSLTVDQIAKNWEDFVEVIETHFPEERAKKILAMYEDLGDRVNTSPASSIDHYHNAFIGGYIDHVLRVTRCAKQVYQLWKDNGADMSGYTAEELMFVALHHDLGKLGFPGKNGEIYVANDSDWHVKNQGRVFKHNENNPFALVNDMSLWLLQYYGISISFNEMIGIKCTDGLYDDANKPYFISRSKDSKLRTNLPYIMHQADLMAARIEFEMWRDTAVPLSHKPKTTSSKKSLSLSTQSVDTSQLFKDLFGA